MVSDDLPPPPFTHDLIPPDSRMVSNGVPLPPPTHALIFRRTSGQWWYLCPHALIPPDSGMVSELEPVQSPNTERPLYY